MRNLLVIFLSVTLIFSCKKKANENDFQPTDVTGITLVKGNISKPVIAPDGIGGWNNNFLVPAKGINVAITVNKSSLYPLSSSQGADVYNGSTDEMGNYSIPVRSNASGVQAKITIDGFSDTQDTLVNGSTKTGVYTIFTGTSTSSTLFMGQNFTLNYTLKAKSAVSSSNTVIVDAGTAVISGSIGIEYLKETIIGTNPPFYSPIIVPFPANHKVYFKLDKDPSTLQERTYETTTDGNGYYKFNVSTVSSGTSGFLQSGVVWINDLAATRDTIKSNNTIKAGTKGVYQMHSKTILNVFNNTIKNGNHLSYINFVPD